MDIGDCFLYRENETIFEIIKTKENVGLAIPVNPNELNDGITAKRFNEDEVEDDDFILNMHFISMGELCDMLYELGEIEVLSSGKKEYFDDEGIKQSSEHLFLRKKNKILHLQTAPIIQEFKAYNRIAMKYIYLNNIAPEKIRKEDFIWYREINEKVLARPLTSKAFLSAKLLDKEEMEGYLEGIDLGPVIIYNLTGTDNCRLLGNGIEQNYGYNIERRA